MKMNRLDGYKSVTSRTNRNDWSMNPNRVDLDLSTVNTMASPAQNSVIVQDQIEWSQEFRIESEQDSEIDWYSFLPFTPIVKLMEMPQDLSE